ncbi:LYR motif-containing protein 2 isoform X2 [Syngnathoides biaculeatus]|uniref:LYR motif-containing protein 2 isoform X2 n=1 Tax=Syngnathoides biaculeatus TaxID=300417 RepID=UPI002ADDB851|nr:LYR motif-containing protein 2 isoform X2 [Syngnathoides biaculeatus]
MATPRIPSTVLSLKQFLQRQNILGIYRNMLRTIRYVPDAADRKYLRDWAREEFKRNKHATDQDLQASLENLRLPGSLSGCSAAVVLETKQGVMAPFSVTFSPCHYRTVFTVDTDTFYQLHSASSQDGTFKYMESENCTQG